MSRVSWPTFVVGRESLECAFCFKFVVVVEHFMHWNYSTTVLVKFQLYVSIVSAEWDRGPKTRSPCMLVTLEEWTLSHCLHQTASQWFLEHLTDHLIPDTVGTSTQESQCQKCQLMYPWVLFCFSDFRMTICKLFFTFFSFTYSNLSCFSIFPIKMTVELGLHRFFC